MAVNTISSSIRCAKFTHTSNCSSNIYRILGRLYIIWIRLESSVLLAWPGFRESAPLYIVHLILIYSMVLFSIVLSLF